jgi:subtilisin family serine protease
MRRPVALLLTSLLASLVASLSVAGPGWAGDRPRQERIEPRGSRDVVAGEVLVRFKGRGLDTPARTVAGVGGRVAQSLERSVPGLRRVVLDDDVTVSAAIAELEARDDVLYAEPNYVVRAAALPGDSLLGELWSLHNTGQRVRGVAGAADADIDAPEAWNVTTGSTAVTVAVLDSGVAYDHPDLAPNMWVNAGEIAGNGVDDDRNGFVDDRRGWDFASDDADPADEQGHGTHVAGTIGARGGNDTAGAGTTDIAGVAWNVRLMPLRVLDQAGEGSYADLIAGIDYARQNGAQIANLSLGARYDSQALRDAMAAGTGVLWVVAAGNDSADLGIAEQYPCKFDIANLVCVAASDSRDRLAGFSNYGRTSVDVAAPGVSTLSASPYSQVFLEDFETPIAGRWVTGGSPDTWARTTEVPAGAAGTWLTDSPHGPYPNASENWARTQALDLSGTRDCLVRFHAVLDIESFFDFLRVEAATTSTGPWTEMTTLTGFWPVPDEPIEARLPDGFDGVPAAHLRFRLNPDDQFDGDGAYLDNVSLLCGGVYSAGSFEYLSGTSMATPHVTGVAALVKARNPGFSTSQLRSRLLASTDKKTSLAGKVATGGRINAHKAVR